MSFNQRIGFTLAALALLVSAPASAQKHVNQAPGIDPRGQFAVGEIDAINLFNGNLTASIPLGPSYPVGPEFSYQMNLVWTSGVWQSRRICPETVDLGFFGYSPYTTFHCEGGGNLRTTCTFQPYDPPPNAGTGEEWTPHPNDECTTKSFVSPGSTAGLGWSLHFGLILPGRQSGADPWERAAESTQSFVYLAPDGSEHVFHLGLTTTDGTYLRLPNCALGDCLLLERPDGSEEEFLNLGSAAEPDYRMVERRDRFGNWLRVNYRGNPSTLDYWIVTDSRGRTHHIQLSSAGAELGPTVYSVDLAAPNGRRLTYVLDQVACTIPRGAPHQIAATANVVAPFLASVRALDGTTLLAQWQMPTTCSVDGQSSSAYDLTGLASSPTMVGALQQVILPTGGRIEWSYRREEGVSLPSEPGFLNGYRYPAGSSGRRLPRANIGVRVKKVFDRTGAALGTWTYDPGLEDMVATRPSYCFPINTGDGHISLDPVCHEKHFKTRVKDPAGTVTEHFFSAYPIPDFEDDNEPTGWDLKDYGLPFWPDVSIGSGADKLSLSERTRDAAGAIVRERWVRYERDPGFTPDGDGAEIAANHRMAAERTVFPADGGRYREVVRSGWDDLGHFTQVIERGGANWPGAGGTVSERTTNLTYALDISTWMLERMTKRSVVEGGKTEAMEWSFRELGAVGELRPGTWVVDRSRAFQSTSGNPGTKDHLTAFDYDSQGQLIGEKHYGGDRQAIALGPLDAIGLPAKAGFRAVHTYSRGVRQSTRILDDCHNSAEVLKTLDLTIDANTGLATASADAAGAVTGYEYDVLGRPTKLKPAGVSATEYEYNLADLWIKTQTGTCSGSTCPHVRQSFLYLDGLGRVLQESNWWPNRNSGTPKYANRQWVYDGLGRTTKESTWRYNEHDFNGVDPFPSGWTEFMDFDAFSRSTKVRPPEGGGHDATVSYTGHGEREAVKTSKVATGTAGAETAVSRTEVYDAFGRLIEVKEPSGTNGTLVTTKYRYDVGNRLTRVETTAGAVTQVRSFEYDALGQLRSETHPELGANGNGSKGYDFYDALGNPGLASIVGTSGSGLRSQVYRYDAAGRPIEVFDGRDLNNPLKQYFYSRQNPSGTNWTKGKLVRTRRHHSELGLWIAESFDYAGPGGRMSQKVTRLTGQPAGERVPAFTQSYNYSPLGDLASISYPQCGSTDGSCVAATTGRTVSSTFNRGLLDSVPGFVDAIDYSANGRISRLLHRNGIEELQDNDPLGQSRPEKLQVKKGTSVLWETSLYQYDGTGNIKAIGDQTLKYDGVSRLLEGRVLQNPTTFQTEALTFDAFGNITSRSVSGAANSAPAVTGSTNRLAGATYDASGNLLQLNATSTLHTFDVLDEMRARLDGSTTWQYLYTADGERVIERNPATGLMRWTLRGPGNQPLRILEDRGAGTWTLLRDYIYAGSRLVASVGTEGPRYYHLDHLGSVRLETNDAGAIVKQRSFLPFGEELSTGGVSENEMRFTGHERDDVAAGSADDLDYMHARFGSPTMGRFLSVDPVGGSPGDPQGWNRYEYAMNSPLVFYDPTGESAQIATGLWQFAQEFPQARINGGSITVSASALPPPRLISSLSLPPKTDCHKFAYLVEIMTAEPTPPVSSFMSDLATTFTDIPSASYLGLIRQQYGTPNPHFLRFGSSGFQPAFFEANTSTNQPSNQVRHAVGGMVAGFVRGFSAGLTSMNAREDTTDLIHGLPDFYLNTNTVQLGADLAGPQGRQRLPGLSRRILSTLCTP